MLDTEAREQIYEELRRQRPAQVRAIVAGLDEPKLFKPSGNRTRWKRLAESLPAETTRVEFLDTKGAVLWAGDCEIEESDGKPATELERLLDITNKHSQKAVELAMKDRQQANEGLHNLVNTLMTRLGQCEQMLADCIKVVYESHVLAGRAQAQADSAGKSDLDEKMFDEFLQMAKAKWFAREHQKQEAAKAAAAAAAAKKANGNGAAAP